MASSHFSIPDAIDVEFGRYIKPHEADPHAIRGRYICRDTSCNKPVKRILRNNTCFFRHYPNCGSVNHSKSQDLHTRAIHEIRNQFDNFIENRLSMPVFLLNTKQGPKEVIPFLPEYIVKTEWPMNGRKIDVAILDRYQHPILLIEILHTSKVTKEKSLDIQEFPWVEIKARSVISNPRILLVERHHRFPQEYDDVIQLDLY
jgi:hypothetical protein